MELKLGSFLLHAKFSGSKAQSHNKCLLFWCQWPLDQESKKVRTRETRNDSFPPSLVRTRETRIGSFSPSFTKIQGTLDVSSDRECWILHDIILMLTGWNTIEMDVWNCDDSSKHLENLIFCQMITEDCSWRFENWVCFCAILWFVGHYFYGKLVIHILIIIYHSWYYLLTWLAKNRLSLNKPERSSRKFCDFSQSHKSIWVMHQAICIDSNVRTCDGS